VLVEAILRRSVYLVLLLENPAALVLLVQLCAASSWFADFLARQPLLLDELLDVDNLFHVSSASEMAQELKQYLLRLPVADQEQTMATTRYFKHANLLRIAAMEVTGQLPLMRVSDQLTQVAETLLQAVLQQAWQELAAIHGQPCNQEGPCDQFIIVGYGKVGGWELSYSSDLDLVFIYQMPSELMTDGHRSVANSVFCTRLGQRIIHLLNTMTAAGRLYEVDMRLRPDGAKGLLVSSLGAFERYQLNDAWTWEHQALTRARPLAGCVQLQQQFQQVRQQVLAQPRELTQLRADVVQMRNRMRAHLGSKAGSGQGAETFHLKQDEGGIVDIEFLVQYAVLAHAHQHPQLLTYTDNIRILDSLQQVGLMAAADAEGLRDAYRALRTTEHRLTLQNQASWITHEALLEERHKVKSIWHRFIGVV
jgi:glutamate-ammonia-ligase adenylyltransferase